MLGVQGVRRLDERSERRFLGLRGERRQFRRSKRFSFARRSLNSGFFSFGGYFRRGGRNRQVFDRIETARKTITVTLNRASPSRACAPCALCPGGAAGGSHPVGHPAGLISGVPFPTQCVTSTFQQMLASIHLPPFHPFTRTHKQTKEMASSSRFSTAILAVCLLALLCAPLADAAASSSSRRTLAAATARGKNKSKGSGGKGNSGPPGEGR